MLEAVRERLVVAGPSTQEERLLGDIFDVPTDVAGSEILAPSDKLADLDYKIDIVREFLFKNGTPWVQHPDHLKKWSDGSDPVGDKRTLDELSKLYFYSSKNSVLRVELLVDIEKPHDEVDNPYRLFMIVDTEGCEAELSFDFSGNFTLYCGFTEKVQGEHKVRYKYRSGEKHIAYMTDEECQIINYFMDQFYTGVGGNFNQELL